jgi:hypothetical protein
MGREFFKCFHDYRKKCEKLSDQEVGRLFRALMEYSEYGTAPELAGREAIAFDFIAEDIARDRAAYEQKCRTNAENGSKGGKRTQANATERKRTEAKPSETDKIKDIREKNKSPNGDITLARSDDRFETFWASYPRHEGKASAKKAFTALKVTDELLRTMLDAINRQKASEQWQNPKYIPMPTTWLHGRRWEDEPLRPQKGRLDHLKELYDQTVQEEGL